jgi:thermostable 8-oxoguanine DNA glycosylase
MELHKDIRPPKKYDLHLALDYMDYFRGALAFANEFYQEDVDRIRSTNFNTITPEEFFREYMWCVYTSGFNAKVVSRMFPILQDIYRPLDDVFAHCKINIDSVAMAHHALAICNNKRKVRAIINMAFKGGPEIKKSGWVIYKETKLSSPDKLKELPFIGPITCYHLARNIGLLNYIKPDLHLNRMAINWKFENPVELCKSIQKEFNLPLGIIDLVLWYAASTFGTNEKSNSIR